MGPQKSHSCDYCFVLCAILFCLVKEIRNYCLTVSHDRTLMVIFYAITRGFILLCEEKLEMALKH